MQAIKEFNFSYSVLTPQANLLSSGTALNNMYSKKIGIASMQKLCVFDQVVFGRSSDQIKEFMMSTYPRQWKVAVFYRRMLQIYDQISGQQIFEIFVPSARKIAFLDSENLIIVQEGRS